jgi:hypothetical protein
MYKISLYLAITITLLSSSCKRKSHFTEAQLTQYELVKNVFYTQIQPADDSAEWHLNEAYRFLYLRDTVTALQESAVGAKWDHKADSLIKKYQVKQFIDKYKNLINEYDN